MKLADKPRDLESVAKELSRQTRQWEMLDHFQPELEDWFSITTESPQKIVERYTVAYAGKKWACLFHAVSFDKTISNQMLSFVEGNLELSETGEVSEFEKEFNELSQQWYKETRKLSSVQQIILNPHYQKIIGMGAPALPFIFRELRKTRGHWLWALHMITRNDQAKPGQNFKEAVDSWINWGEENGYI